MNRKKLLQRLAGGALHNVAFLDMVDLVGAFGFRLSRVAGSHHIFVHPAISEIVNLQDSLGEAKPYQIRQFLRLVERHNLKMEDGK